MKKQVRLIEKYNTARIKGQTERAEFFALSLRIVFGYRVAR